MTKETNYVQQMVLALSKTIEDIGANDPNYTVDKKALDILTALEHILAYTIYTTCPDDAEGIQKSAEYSYDSIKERALLMLKDPPKA